MAAQKVPACPSGEFWIVKAGDTIYRIANATGRSVGSILRENPGINPENLRIGMRVCLPSLTTCASGIYWTIEPGDSLYKIAQASGTTARAILRLNPGIDPHNLEVGHKLCLPV